MILSFEKSGSNFPIYRCKMKDNITGEEYLADFNEDGFQIAKLEDIFFQRGYDMQLIQKYGSLRFSQGQKSTLED